MMSLALLIAGLLLIGFWNSGNLLIVVIIDKLLDFPSGYSEMSKLFM
jgi:hypothetical protein